MSEKRVKKVFDTKHKYPITEPLGSCVARMENMRIQLLSACTYCIVTVRTSELSLVTDSTSSDE